MLVPLCFHGLLKDVKKETKKVARKLLKGQSLDEAFGAYEMLDTKNYPNSIFYIERTVQVLCSPDDFHFPWLISFVLDISFDANRETHQEEIQKVFERLLKTDWGVLCLCDGQNGTYANPPFYDDKIFDRHIRFIPFLKAITKYWSEYQKMGKVFDKDTIWNSIFSLKYILCKMNVAPEKLSEIHDTIDLEELVKDYDLLNCDISTLPCH